jgi:hypothetical protein
MLPGEGREREGDVDDVVPARRRTRRPRLQVQRTG